MDSVTSQTDQILAYLREGNALTPLEALERFGCLRLGARVWDLKQAGFDIRSELIERNGKRFAQYTLVH
jgi:hypothetical protein